MKRIAPIILIQLVSLAVPSSAQTVYSNGFSSQASIQDFTIIGERFVGYTPPPLHTVSVQNSQLQITTSILWPNGVGTPPVLEGSALLMRSNTDFGSDFTSVLSENASTISWAFNVAYQGGSQPNMFDFVLGSTLNDPTLIGAHGYYVRGGFVTGGHLTLSRFDYGTGGGQDVIIDAANGLSTMPQLGSFRITFDPLTDEWRLFGETGSSFQDPMLASTLLGSGVDSAYVNQSLPYFGIGGSYSGVDTFDNVSITIPEPSTMSLILAAFAMGILSIRRNWNAKVNAGQRGC